MKGIIYLDDVGNVLPVKDSLDMMMRDYRIHRLGTSYRSKISMPWTDSMVNVGGYFYDGRCSYCVGRKDWRLLRTTWPKQMMWHIQEHLAFPFMLILKNRYPIVYEEVVMGVLVKPKYSYIDEPSDEKKIYPVGSDIDRTKDIVNLMDELLLVRDMSLRVYNEIMDSGELKYYNTAMLAVKEIRGVAETMGKFSLIAKQLEREGEVERLPGPILEMIKEVSSIKNEAVITEYPNVRLTE